MEKNLHLVCQCSSIEKMHSSGLTIVSIEEKLFTLVWKIFSTEKNSSSGLTFFLYNKKLFFRYDTFYRKNPCRLSDKFFSVEKSFLRIGVKKRNFSELNLAMSICSSVHLGFVNCLSIKIKQNQITELEYIVVFFFKE